VKLGNQVGIGNTAEVYEWEDKTVIKLFHSDYPKDSILREFANASIISQMNFPKPMAYDIIEVEGRLGIIYDSILGESLLDWLLKTRDIERGGEILAQLHGKMLTHKVSSAPNYKDFLYQNLERAARNTDKEHESLFRKLQKLPEGDTFCHGDFHPGNVILGRERPVVIDFMNVCVGDYYYDVARTVFLMEYTPVPDIPGVVEELIKLKAALADQYLIHMKVDREQISDFLEVIISSRPGEY
jgi:uncharacterized protein (TIGR02172 family)